MKWLRRLPLLYKILLVNCAIVSLGAVAGTTITIWHVRSYPQDPHYELIVFFAIIGITLSLALNYALLRLALRPLDHLQSAVDMVRQGRHDVRVDPGSLSDDRFDRLAETFNAMLASQGQAEHELRRLSQELLEAQEEERKRVARELHDEAAQALTSLLVRLRLLERAEDPNEARLQVQELRKLTMQALEEVRRVALELRPTILDDLGLGAAMAWQVDEFNTRHQGEAKLQVSSVDGRLPPDVELVLYRVTQEALTNVARHAQAGHVTITLAREQNRVVLGICDDGVGFDPAAIHAGESGLGLSGMRERLALVGGELTIDSAPGQGTRLTAWAPAGGIGVKGGGCEV
jgi:two-component system, NarL family, sensor histidine kinase UhpB